MGSGWHWISIDILFVQEIKYTDLLPVPTGLLAIDTNSAEVQADIKYSSPDVTVSKWLKHQSKGGKRPKQKNKAENVRYKLTSECSHYILYRVASYLTAFTFTLFWPVFQFGKFFVKSMRINWKY